MKIYCVNCRKNTKNLKQKIFNTRNKRKLILSKCTDRRIEKFRFVKEQEAKGLLSNLGIKIPSLIKISLLNILF